jgi:hypothetical protein
MKTNMGYIDRFIRISIALIIAVLSFTNVITGVLAIVLAILAGIFVITSFIGFCPLYLPFGISTRKKSPEKI